MEDNSNGRKEKEKIISKESQGSTEINGDEVVKDKKVDDEEKVEKKSVDNDTEDINGEGKEDGSKEDKEEGGKDSNREADTADLLDKIDQLEDRIKRLEGEKEAVNNRLIRLQADFSNYRKRNEKELERVSSVVIAQFIEEFLPVLDNFERALAQEDTGDNFRKGIEMIYKQLINFLEKQGVEQIEALGKEFDHNYHNAVMQVETDEFESGIVVEELQKGYILDDIVIRPSMVKVAE